MDVASLKKMSYNDVRARYKSFLCSKYENSKTINTALNDTFYLWRHVGQGYFWAAVESSDENAKVMLRSALSGNAARYVSHYFSYIRCFQTFLASDVTTDTKFDCFKKASSPPQHVSCVSNNRFYKKPTFDIPTPSKVQVDRYLKKWDDLENYSLQEKALNKLFFDLCPNNADIKDILLKVSTLNDFYSTNIYSVYPVAKHIQQLCIDDRLKVGDVSLVDDIKAVSGVSKEFYSFASKYCSHHKPSDYPIYDHYVDEILRYFGAKDAFSSFTSSDLKNYERFKEILIAFQNFYNLQSYSLKQIDQYLWLLGKAAFPKSYGKKQK